MIRADRAHTTETDCVTFFFFFFWLCWVFISVRGLPLVVASGGHSSSRCAGLSLSRPLLLRSTGSRRTGSVVVAHGPSRSAACGIFPDQGSNPCPLNWQADSQPLRHQGSPGLCYFDCDNESSLGHKWDRLGPATLHQSAGTWTDISPPRATEYKEPIRDGTQLHACAVGAMMNNKIQKGQTNCHFWGAGSKSRVLHMISAHSTTKGRGRPPKLPLQPDPLICPHPHPVKGTSHPSQRVSKGYLFLLPHAAAWVLIKPCLNSSSGLLSISTD